jgi:hypothetical protein
MTVRGKNNPRKKRNYRSKHYFPARDFAGFPFFSIRPWVLLMTAHCEVFGKGIVPVITVLSRLKIWKSNLLKVIDEKGGLRKKKPVSFCFIFRLDLSRERGRK